MATSSDGSRAGAPGVQGDHAGGHERVVLAEAVSGHEGRRRLAALDARAIAERVDDEERGLRERGLAKLAARIVEAELANGIAEHAIGLGRPVGKPIEQIGAHALRLRSLSGKEAGDSHRVMPARTGRAILSQ